MGAYDAYDSYGAAGSTTIVPRKLIRGLEVSDFRKLAHLKEIPTHSGAACYLHRLGFPLDVEPDSNLNRVWTDEENQCIDEVRRRFESLRLLQVDLCVGRGESRLHARLLLPLWHAELAYMAGRTFESPPRGWIDRDDADITALVWPEWSGQGEFERKPRVLIDVEGAIAYILGCDAYGEVMGGLLRLAMHKARIRGELPLHAAATQFLLQEPATEKLAERGVLFLGPYGSGKTALACHSYELNLSAGERARVRQDAGVLLSPSGEARGLAGAGFYVRTDHLNLDDHVGLYDACSSDEAVLENVWLHSDGSVDFYDTAHGRSGRAVVPITSIFGADGRTDLPQCTHVFFLTHNPWLPPVIQLTAAQATAAFMLGEMVAIEPDSEPQQGIVAVAQRLAGSNPYRLGPADADGNLLFEFLVQRHTITTCLLNTGRIGLSESGRNITLRETASIIRETCRGAVEWGAPDRFGMVVPTTVPGTNPEDLRVDTIVPEDELTEGLTWLRDERKSYLHEFDQLAPEVKAAVF